MKTRIFTKLFYALLATMQLTSCDEHFEEDFSGQLHKSVDAHNLPNQKSCSSGT